MTVYENIQTRVKDFSSLSPCVYLSLSFSVTCPSPLSSSLSKPLLRPTVSMATLTSQWGRHPHSCCANTAMSHWHTLTHFSVEIALTHTHSHWTEYKNGSGYLQLRSRRRAIFMHICGFDDRTRWRRNIWLNNTSVWLKRTFCLSLSIQAPKMNKISKLCKYI